MLQFFPQARGFGPHRPGHPPTLALRPPPNPMPARAKEVFQEIQQEKKFFTHLLDAVENALMAFDGGGHLLWANKAGERLCGAPTRRLIGQNYRAFGLDPHLSEIMDRFRAGERVKQIETCVRSPVPGDGTETEPWVALVTCSTLTEDGHLKGGVLMVEDVTEVRDRAKARLQKDSITALSGLTASLAHELKNPLGAIDLHIQLLERLLRNAGGRPLTREAQEEMGEMTHILSDELGRLDRMLSDFLTSVRPLKPRRRSDDLNRIVEEALTFMAPEIDSHKIILMKDLSPDIPALMLDPDLIKQALLNLFKNSVAAMARTGRPARLTVSTRCDPETVLLSVADTGEGIPSENLTKIFEPFFTTRDMGTGLGLSIVHRIFTEHGGALVLHSKVGEGTDFRVEFHLKSPTPPLLPSPHPETPNAPGH